MKLHRSLLTVAVLLTGLADARAQVDDPATVAQEYFRLMQTEGVASVVKVMHPDALADFKSMILPIVSADDDSGANGLRLMLFGEKTAAEVAELPAADFMAGMMTLTMSTLGDSEVSFDKMDVIGVLPEDDVRHVLVRQTITLGDLSQTKLEVLSMAPHEGTWRMLLSGEMQGVADALRAAMQ